MVEFAFVLPIFLLLVMGILDFGFLFYNYISMENAARNAARVACVDYEDVAYDSQEGGQGKIIKRDLPLPSENATDKAFIDWRDTRNITQTNDPLVAQICEYCKKYSEQSGKPVRTHVIDGVEHLVDPWGNPYNADMLYRFHDEGIRKSLRDYTVGGIVLWSSGPNGINENGGGDDIFELSRKTWCQRRGAADE